MYMTRFEINPQRRAARDMLASPQRLHAAVLAAFPESSSDGGRVLWRLDPGAHDAVLYIVSPDKPDLSHLVESIGRPTYGWQTRDYGPFLDRLAAGERWAFRLCANPVHNVPAPGGGRGKRVGHVTAAQQTDWFLRRVERSGFAIVDGTAGAPDLVLRSRRTLRFARRNRTVTLSTAVFEGTLNVVDPILLRAALTQGIGPGKGYGCGLLTLAAAR
ncbi:type I-E CRISPR-associated protein Cas6/Cse3/CasE [Pseudonocardia oroxyli]|uniref:CRISPR system Cascade subunit CasE n=1 Tax=Pseudonocardia oroxyli TaxID=366584 RepID=A0A1G8AFV5_PSEOR|nr:type I-E CRISPR-associated protein Cas6/Cse3/CasE [Pseudonocardia oroxyli]SDH19781.1 CRISPR system Cascade subunit CasE [Pseudonocardia oroxyli]